MRVLRSIFNRYLSVDSRQGLKLVPAKPSREGVVQEYTFRSKEYAGYRVLVKDIPGEPRWVRISVYHPTHLPRQWAKAHKEAARILGVV